MNTHLFNAFTQFAHDLEASGFVRPRSALAHDLRVVDRRTLMQWGSESSRYLLVLTSTWSSLTRLQCSVAAAALANEAMNAAIEDKVPLRTFLIEGSRMREVDLVRAGELLLQPSPYGLSHSGANSGLLTREGSDFASWILRPLLMRSGTESETVNLSAEGTFGRVTEQRLQLKAPEIPAASRAKTRASAAPVVPAELMAEDRVSFQAREGGHDLADFADAPTHCLTIQLLPGARAALSANRLDAIADLACLSTEMPSQGIGRPLVRMQVQVGDVPIDELLRQLNPDGWSWESMASAFGFLSGGESDQAVELAAALKSPQVLSEIDWAELCAQICPGSPVARADVTHYERQAQ